MDNCNCGFGASVPKFGTPGATFIPHVTESADAVELSWTNNRGLPNPDPVKIPNGGSNSSGGNVDLSNYYSKPEIDAIMGAYVDDIDALIGGDE